MDSREQCVKKNSVCCILGVNMHVEACFKMEKSGNIIWYFAIRGPNSRKGLVVYVGVNFWEYSGNCVI